MASVRVRNKKLYIDYREGGKRKRIALGLLDSRDNRKKAELTKKQMEYELSAGIYKDRFQRNDISNKRLTDGFLEFKKAKSNLKSSTIDYYEYAFNKFLKYSGNLKIKDVNENLVEQIKICMHEDIIMADKKKKLISSNTVASYFLGIRVLFQFFEKKGYIDKNPIPKLQCKAKQILVIPDKELEMILSKLKYTDKKHLEDINKQHYKFVAILLMTGLRVSELVTLSFDDIDFRENLIRVKNEKKDRIDFIPLYEDLRKFILKEWKIREGKLFNYSSRNSLKFFERFIKREGYPNYTFHTLRKTYISKLINSGLSVYDVMTLARHKNIKTTLKHYTAAELQRMGKAITTLTNLGTLLGTADEKELKILKSVS